LLERVVGGGSTSEILDAIFLALEQYIAADTIATVLLVVAGSALVTSRRLAGCFRIDRIA
tara:strand:+ start:2705 stop:2884 length:180 start_codon:yes stop_codon:yes gene_type:complete